MLAHQVVLVLAFPQHIMSHISDFYVWRFQPLLSLYLRMYLVLAVHVLIVYLLTSEYLPLVFKASTYLACYHSCE